MGRSAVLRERRAAITGCSFANNGAAGINDSWGGAIVNVRSDPEITDCEFVLNTALNPVFWASNAYGGAIVNTLNSAPVISGCTFRENRAQGADFAVGKGYGGAVYSADSITTLTDCSFIENDAQAAADYCDIAHCKGGAIYSSGCDVTMTG